MSAHAIDGQFFDIACRFYADGSLYLPDNRTLILSDLHLGKGAAQRMTSPMPGYDTDDTLNRLEAAIMRTDPSQTILLGDSFHSPEQAEMLPAYHLDHIMQIARQTDLVWIEGNHDPSLPHRLPGQSCSYLTLGSLLLCHQPAYQAEQSERPVTGQIIGHYHPKARLQLKARNLSAKCFIHDHSLMILPAFGAFTGGLNILHDEIQTLLERGQQSYVLHQQSIYHFPVSRRHFRQSV